VTAVFCIHKQVNNNIVCHCAWKTESCAQSNVGLKEGCHLQAGGENRQIWQLVNPAWYPLFRGWRVMVHDTHTRRRSPNIWYWVC